MTEEEWADFDRRRIDSYYEDSPPPHGALPEEEWLASAEPQRMLELFAGKNSDRKLRLFACACCRDIWHLLRDAQERHAVEVAEWFADGEATLEELVVAHEGCCSARTAGSYASNDGRWEDMYFAVSCCCGETIHKARKQSNCREAVQSRLLRDIFGNPFRPVTLDPAWQTSTVVALAHAAYDDRTLPAGTLDSTRLAILADALEEAGCDNADILNHLRGPGEHVSGCWALDLLLGKD